MSTITLNTQTVVSIAAGDVLELPVSAGQARIIGLNVGGDATLRPLSGGTIDGTAGDYSIGSGNYVLFTSGSQGSTWCLLSEGSSTPVVESVSGTSGQIASTGGTDPILSFAWSASANQIVGLNNAGTAYEAKTLFAGANMSINHTANGITLTSSGGGGGVTSVTGTANQIGSTGGSTPVISIVSNPVIAGTGSIQIPAGTTAQRPSPVDGQIRFNTDQAFVEYQYNSGGWAGVPRLSQGAVSGNYVFPNGGDLEIPSGNVANRANTYGGLRMNDTSSINGTSYGFLELFNSEVFQGAAMVALDASTGDQEAIIAPSGTDAGRPATPLEGMIRWNTTAHALEAYDGTSWVQYAPTP